MNKFQLMLKINITVNLIKLYTHIYTQLHARVHTKLLQVQQLFYNNLAVNLFITLNISNDDSIIKTFKIQCFIL